jgi:RND family efflux transporter MFP subunit
MQIQDLDGLAVRIRQVIRAPLWVGALAVVALSGAAVWLLTPSSENAAAAEAQASGIVLSPEQQRAAGIEVAALKASPLPRVYRVPGEVRANDYTAGIVAPRVTATVVARRARLGDRVAKGQVLVTLYSQDVAAAQSDHLLAQRNLARMTRLKDVVARQLVDEAGVKAQEARGRLQSLGLTEREIGGLGTRGLGQFTLAATQSGAVIEDNFRVGDVVEAGKTLFQIANLSGVWIEAAVSPAILPQIQSADATVMSGETVRNATIVQTRDTVDEATRTVGVRLQMRNPDGALRPGQFVDVELFGSKAPVLNLPTAAVLREASGRWVVFAQRADKSFEAVPVKVLYAAGERTAVAGIARNTRVVTSGAFFVMSEGAKASFGEED